MDRSAGRRSSTLSLPLRVRVTMQLVARQRARRGGVEHLPPGRAGRRPSTVSTRYWTSVIDSCSAGARSTRRTAPVAGMPSGSTGVSRCGRASVSTGSVSSTSRYSASLSCPTDSASPKLTLGRGENPSVNASGQLLDAEGALERAGDVAVRDEPHLAPLGEADAHREAADRPSSQAPRWPPW